MIRYFTSFIIKVPLKPERYCNSIIEIDKKIKDVRDLWNANLAISKEIDIPPSFITILNFKELL